MSIKTKQITYNNTKTREKQMKIHPNHLPATIPVSPQWRVITCGAKPCICFICLQIDLSMRFVNKTLNVVAPAVTNISLALSHLSLFSNNLKASIKATWSLNLFSYNSSKGLSYTKVNNMFWMKKWSLYRHMH